MAKVLVVDDERSIRTTLSAFLEMAGYEVDTADDAQAAEDLLTSETYDVVVSDIILPGVSGIELLARIRRLAPTSRVIMMTGEPNMSTAMKAIKEGACDYLTKPVGKAAILKAVTEALDKQRPRA